MKILVTGGAGFVGTNLIKKLLQEKHIVHSLDNYTTGLDN
jgi:nucleoside-diphosphate-sugar epimerase